MRERRTNLPLEVIEAVESEFDRVVRGVGKDGTVYISDDDALPIDTIKASLSYLDEIHQLLKSGALEADYREKLASLKSKRVRRPRRIQVLQRLSNKFVLKYFKDKKVNQEVNPDGERVVLRGVDDIFFNLKHPYFFRDSVNDHFRADHGDNFPIEALGIFVKVASVCPASRLSKDLYYFFDSLISPRNQYKRSGKSSNS